MNQQKKTLLKPFLELNENFSLVTNTQNISLLLQKNVNILLLRIDSNLMSFSKLNIAYLAKKSKKNKENRKKETNKQERK